MSNLLSPALLSVAGAPTLAATGAGAAAPIPMAAEGSDAARFQSLMQAPDVSASAAQMSPVVAGHLPRPASSIGDAVVKALSNTSNDFKGVFSAAEKAAASGNLTVAQGLSLQLNVSQVLIHYDLVSKGVSKAQQTVDTLVKTQ